MYTELITEKREKFMLSYALMYIKSDCILQLKCIPN